jgi:acyl transferase domain-containing protein
VVEALTKAFRAGTEKKNFCALGSVKTNIGHCDNAAGMASLIKAVLALKHGLIPPTLHFQAPAPHINLADSPFYVNAAPVAWQPVGHPRRAGVSSLGIGGTNAHLLLEEAPGQTESGDARPWQLLVLSAKSEAALGEAASNVANHLRHQPDVELADVAHTLQVGRRRFNHRCVLVCRTADEAVRALEADDARLVLRSVEAARERPITFMFPGLGDHHVGMARDLYRHEPTFRAHVERCAELLKPHLNLDLREILYPAGAEADGQTEAAGAATPTAPFSTRQVPDLRKLLQRGEPSEDEATRRLNQTRLTQPAVFVIEYALAQLLLAWGIRPQSMIGYSIGEYVAACLAGVFSLEDALYLVAERARMIDGLPRGAMLAIPLPADEVERLLADGLSLSASNGPALSVVAGTDAAVEVLEQRLAQRGVACRRLQTSHAFHSQMMEPAVAGFTELVGRVQLNAPQIPFVSNLTGTWITAEEATRPDYWARHMRHTVRFAEGLGEVLNEPGQILLEVGPGQGLSTLARQHTLRRAEQAVLPTLRDRRDEVADVPFLLSTIGRLWLAGARVDWPGFAAHERRRRVPLPTYPFERQRYWVEPGKQGPGHAPREDATARKPDLTDWFHVPSWKQSPLPTRFEDIPPAAAHTAWLIFGDETGVAQSLAHTLGEKGYRVVQVAAGEGFGNSAADCYTINPVQLADYEALILELTERGPMPDTVVHMWGVTADADAAGLDAYETARALGFNSLVLLAQALGERNVTSPVHIGVVTSHAQSVTGDELTCPLKAMVGGACKVVAQEYPNISCQSIDVVTPAPGAAGAERLTRQLLAELVNRASHQTVAYRGGQRWVKDFEPVRLEARPQTRPQLREGATYLITGGLEEIGLLLAEHLSHTYGAKLALIVPPSFPAHGKWERWLSAHDGEDETSGKIRRLRAIAASGHEVLVIPADVADEEQMSAAVANARAQLGEIRGVIHAATAAAAGIIQLKTPESSAALLDPKVKGALVLASVTKELPLDFFALCSSTVALAGGLGQADACAANAFLDAFAHYRASHDDRPTVAINWSAFQWDSWQLPAGIGFSELATHLQESLATFGIKAAEAVAVFERILSSPLPQVIVSPRDLQTMLAQTDAVTASSLMQAVGQARPSASHARPQLAVAYVAPGGEVERTIAAVWQEAFGLEQVGVHDNFFELAGNSLLAIQIVTRLRDILRVQLPLTSLFEAPTISQLAQIVAAQRSSNPEESEASRLLSEIEVFTLAEVEEILAREVAPPQDGFGVGSGKPETV